MLEVSIFFLIMAISLLCFLCNYYTCVRTFDLDLGDYFILGFVSATPIINIPVTIMFTIAFLYEQYSKKVP